MLYQARSTIFIRSESRLRLGVPSVLTILNLVHTLLGDYLVLRDALFLVECAVDGLVDAAANRFSETLFRSASSPRGSPLLNYLDIRGCRQHHS